MKLSALLARLLPFIVLFALMNARAADAPQPDPKVWGAYAQLVGHRFKSPHDGWPGYEIVWSKPGEEIRESKLWFNTGQVEWTRLVRPGAKPGELIATGTGEYHKTAQDWIGTIGADGSVSFALQKGLLKAPYRVTATEGRLKFEQSAAPPFAFLPEAVAPAATAVAVQTPAAAPGTPTPHAAVPGAPAPAPTGEMVGVAATLSAGNAPAAHVETNWGVLEKLADKTWELHNSGQWATDRTVLDYRWSADRSAITLSSGDGYASRQIDSYRVDPATGGLIAATQDEDGKPVQAPVQIDSNGAVTVQLGEKRRSVTSIHSDSGALKKTVEKLTWGGDWKTIETSWYFNAAPGPEWGVFSKLVGYNWVLNDYVSLHFRWLPQSRVAEVAIYSMFVYEGGIDFSQRADHPNHLVARGEGSEYQLNGAPVGLAILDGETKATQISGKNRYTYELLSAPDRLLIHSEKWVDGELKKTTGTFYREDQAQKNERIAGVNNYLRHKEASDRTTRTLQNQAALYNALTAANEVAAARVAQSQAELDAMLDTLAEQAQYERMEAAAQQAAAEEAARQGAREREQDATVAAAMAQARQLAREAGDEGVVDRTIAETNRTIDQQEKARQQRIAAQEREAQLNAQQQMKQFVQSSQTQQARPQPPSKPATAKTGTDAGSASYYHMGCSARHGRSKVTYLSDIATVPQQGEQERWNAEFFKQFIAQRYNLAQPDTAASCFYDRNSEAGAHAKLEMERKWSNDNGFSIVEIDWSPEKRY